MPRLPLFWAHRFCVGASALIFAFCLTGTAQAALLDPAEIDASRLLPPPPKAGSAAAKAEIAELHAIAASSTPDLLEKARRDDGDEKPDIFNAALGFDIMALPAANRLLTEMPRKKTSTANPPRPISTATGPGSSIRRSRPAWR